MFDEVNPWRWVKKCQKYFAICSISDHQKIEIVTMYLFRKVEL